MGRKAAPVQLSDSDRARLISMTKSGLHRSREIIRARALLLMDAGKSCDEVCAAVEMERQRYYKIKRRYFEGGLEAALRERPRSGQPPKITERLEAYVTAIACSDAPEGSCRWTLSMIGDKLVELDYVESISRETVRKVLKKANLSLGESRCGASGK
jgi:transposase